MARRINKINKSLEIANALLLEGWVEQRGDMFTHNPNTWSTSCVSTNELIAVSHPVSGLVYVLGVINSSRRGYADPKYGFCKMTTNKPLMTGGKLRSPVRWYNIGPITACVVDQVRKLVTNKEGNVAVSYGI